MRVGCGSALAAQASDTEQAEQRRHQDQAPLGDRGDGGGRAGHRGRGLGHGDADRGVAGRAAGRVGHRRLQAGIGHAAGAGAHGLAGSVVGADPVGADDGHRVETVSADMRSGPRGPLDRLPHIDGGDVARCIGGNLQRSQPCIRVGGCDGVETAGEAVGRDGGADFLVAGVGRQRARSGERARDIVGGQEVRARAGRSRGAVRVVLQERVVTRARDVHRRCGRRPRCQRGHEAP